MQGRFLEVKRNGYGKFKLTDESFYRGCWPELKDGFDPDKYTLTDFYEGGWMTDDVHDSGTYYFADRRSRIRTCDFKSFLLEHPRSGSY